MFGFKKLIKIPGKNFTNINPGEFADMIEAYLLGGTKDYDSSALTEFALIPNKVDWLENFRSEITSISENRRQYDQLDGLNTAEGISDLKKIIAGLRAQ